ncbi:glycosyltransferase family 4 protein [Cohnella faecalis]|uniref:Glycosyltransferase n=1 Tax=Cohnella faecalis TaxID=2315694 RepID=A0A398CRA9_9BACL|nr:glycosyltransferase family 4 protein [Cohnella faecalis]RIE03799.1 glycosyltransferase [Cohnella faecalis]
MELERIVIVNHVAQLGGAERVLMNWLEKLDQKRVKAELVLLEDGPLADQAEQLGFGVHILPPGRIRNPGHYRRTVASIREIIRKSGAKLVVSWSPKPHMYGGAAAWLEKIPAVWWQHGVPSGNFFDRLVGYLPSHSIICPSAVVSEAQQKLSPRKRVVVQHPGIPMAEFLLDPQVRSEVRKEFGISESATVFAFIGRLQRWKRAEIVIQAFRDALKGKDACLFIIGGALFGVEEELESELKQLVREAGLESQVIFTGHQSRIAPYLWASDAVVHTSLFEPFGMVLLEAMASGRIVLAVNRGGPAEIIEDGVDGILYDGSVRQLTILMEQIGEEKRNFEKLGAAAIVTVREKFASGVMTERFGRLLSAAIPR